MTFKNQELATKIHKLEEEALSGFVIVKKEAILDLISILRGYRHEADKLSSEYEEVFEQVIKNVLGK